MNRLLVLLFCVLSFAVQAQTSVGAKADFEKKLLLASKAVKVEDWNGAVAAFSEAEAVGAQPMPEVFYYMYGKALNEVSRFSEAEEKIVIYINKYGDKGRFYSESLKQLTVARDGAHRKLFDEIKKKRINADWKKNYYNYKVTKSSGGANCTKTKRRIYKMMAEDALRNFSCECESGYIKYKGEFLDADSCKGTVEANWTIDPAGDITNGILDNKYGPLGAYLLEFDNEPLDK